jgi:hypothetical protein
MLLLREVSENRQTYRCPSCGRCAIVRVGSMGGAKSVSFTGEREAEKSDLFVAAGNALFDGLADVLKRRRK